MNLLTNSEHQHDRLAVVAVMIWPGKDEEKKRMQYMAVSMAQDLLREGKESYVLSKGHIAALCDAPSWDALSDEIGVRTKRATIAGYVLAFMFLMDKYANQLPDRGEAGGTLDKAYYLAEQWAKSDVTYADGSALYASEKSIKDCWREFRPVAHMWAAKELNKAPGFQFVQAKEIFSVEGLPKLLESAAYLQCYGRTKQLTNKAKNSSSKTLLSDDVIWALDTDRHAPKILLPEKDEAISDSPWMKFLRTYEARKN